MGSRPMPRDRHYSCVHTRLVVDHVRRQLGDVALERLLAIAGDVPPAETLVDDTAWLSYDELRRFLEAAAQVLGSIEALHRISDAAGVDGGPMPGSTEAMQATGSANALLADLNAGNTGTNTIEDGFTEQVGGTEWLLHRRLHDGFDPYPELCALQVGMTAFIPRLFGLSGVTVTETECQCCGEDVCTIRLRWEESGSDHERAEFLATRLALVERSFEAFQATVADLVAVDELEPLLQRIVSAAAGSVRALGFVLVLDPLPWPARLVYAVGANDAGAASGKPPSEDDLVVDVESSRRRHGHLRALGTARLLSPSQRAVLEGYARLAASAIDAAIAVEDARRQAATAKALLDLALRIARIDTVADLARTLAEAVPTVVGCDRAVVAIVDLDRGVARPVAASGFDEGLEARLLGREIRLPGRPSTDIVYIEGVHVAVPSRDLMDRLSSVAAVLVPITIDDDVVAWMCGDVTHDPHRLTQSPGLEERLRGLAAQASTAMHNAELLERVRHQADHDALTGLPNRAFALSRAQTLLSSAGRQGSPVTALFVDLDGFKDVNDSLGHAAGDELLQAVAGRLSAAVRGSDVVARLGGDEFLILSLQDGRDAGEHLAQRVLDVLSGPFQLSTEHGHRTVQVTASIGLAEGVGGTADRLVRNADIALYEAKESGKARATRFRPEMTEVLHSRLALEHDLNLALDAGQLVVRYQPIVALADDRVVGLEALLHWQHPTRGLLPPPAFLSELESSNAGARAASWMLSEACARVAEWRRQRPGLTVSVNVSGRQLDDPAFARQVLTALEAAAAAGDALVLEVVEGALMAQAAATLTPLRHLRARGVRVAIDGFGAGRGSLAVLRDLPIDLVKLDPSFLRAMGADDKDNAFVASLLQVAVALDLGTIADGVDHESQLAILRRTQCTYAQGLAVAAAVDEDGVSAIVSGAPPR